jgi:radical SAM protein with 4Fe4S-binding SPASM domain
MKNNNFKKAKSYNKPPMLAGYNYPLGDIQKARQRNQLLTMRLETSRICNLRCIYCNGATGKKVPGEISFKAMKKVILEAKSLGAKSVVVIGGGEPTIYRHFKALIEFIDKNKMVPVVITNGLKLSKDMSRFLYNTNASVLFKLDSLDEQVQDRLAGKKGTYKLIMKGIDNLLSIGFNKNKGDILRCGASFVLTDLNYKDIVGIWKFCRENNIYPNLEELIPRNKGLERLDELWVNKEDVHALKKEILLLDRKKYNYDWLIYTPLPGHGCLQFFYSIYITSEGYIQPCADITIEFYNIKDTSITEAINGPFFNLVRNIEPNLQGKCLSCKHNRFCVGCRGLAFSMGMKEGLDVYESVTKEDPLCCK